MVRRLVLLGLSARFILNASRSAEVALGAATKSNVLRVVKIPHLLDLLLQASLQLFVLFSEDLLHEALLVVRVKLDPLDELSNVLDCLGIHQHRVATVSLERIIRPGVSDIAVDDFVL